RPSALARDPRSLPAAAGERPRRRQADHPPLPPQPVPRGAQRRRAAPRGARHADARSGSPQRGGRRAAPRPRAVDPMKMMDVGEKDRTSRIAIARAELRCSRETLKLLNEGRLEKGDALAAARIAGIMAAKRTPDLLPLCHPISLVGADVDVACDESAGVVRIEARVHAVERTGVEMEALTAAMAAALTLYDMAKRHD